MNLLNLLYCFAFCVGGVARFFINNPNELFHALLSFVVLDYIAGIIKACSKNKLNSEIGAKGILKKIKIFALISLANIFDKEFHLHYFMLRDAITGFFLIKEIISMNRNFRTFIWG